MSKEKKIHFRVNEDQFRLMRSAIFEIIANRKSVLKLVNENPQIILNPESVKEDIELAESILVMMNDKSKDWPF